ELLVARLDLEFDQEYRDLRADELDRLDVVGLKAPGLIEKLDDADGPTLVDEGEGHEAFGLVAGQLVEDRAEIRIAVRIVGESRFLGGRGVAGDALARLECDGQRYALPVAQDELLFWPAFEDAHAVAGEE